MKKFITGLFAALLLTAGFVSLSGQAQAAPSVDCAAKYTICFATKTVAKGSRVTADQHPTVTVTVRAASNAKVKGKLAVKFGDRTIVRSYNDETRVVRLPLMAAGTYKVKVTFTPAATSHLKPSSRSATLVVR
ncbi:hypothetical protein GON03_09540 [Nocardioides sp. MAH-18]|uniref:Bacterial Ig-like domain-containing protein n=1 Tax=Nocardioides agri TaxID=2682843 RepID=A0A6L6XQ55_9ACTN|nr:MULTISPECIES: hypothetical protein [unclassified Nocardioides]MBA2954566.1 hypothetical protein [Nocardioides sp. CGMCC 1.13656]MVQ49424.1 hypothetical protein [Nocardioides sp. MAH-18]